MLRGRGEGEELGGRSPAKMVREKERGGGEALPQWGTHTSLGGSERMNS